MKLSEKIYYYRKKTGKSQEGLAEQLGVSRQAVSKWETGESEPEIAKLKQLALVFGVTVDFLLSEEEPPEKAASDAERQKESVGTTPPYPTWIDGAPRFVGRMFRRFGWLAGVYVAVIGALFLLIGGGAVFISNRMVNSFESSVDSMFQGFGGVYDPFGAAMPQIEVFNPVSMVGGVIIAIGVVLVIGGVLLALWLKKKGTDK